MADLKGTLELLMQRLYGDDCKIRLRPHHFPFTEPSAEVDVMCFQCHGKGCRLCKGEGYIELLGAGMVHPKVLEGCGIDSSVYSGFAFGHGSGAYRQCAAIISAICVCSMRTTIRFLEPVLSGEVRDDEFIYEMAG